jgi:hypothetical protein
MESTTQQKRVSKACDACKRRKVKCNGQERCQQCSHLGLRCVYSATGKLRSQGKRGHIISEFRKQMNNSLATSPPAILPANGLHIQPYNSFTYAMDGCNRFSSGTSSSPTAALCNDSLGRLGLTSFRISRDAHRSSV